MYPNNPNPVGTVPPAQPGAPSAVWPPPPAAGPGAPDEMAWFAFKEEYRRVEGNVSDFRTGWIGVGPNGIIIRGKTALRSEIQTPILIVMLILSLFLAVIVGLILEYACRSESVLPLAWDQIKKVVIAPEKSRVCLVFTAPNHSGRIKTFSLAFQPDAANYQAFVQAVQAYLPDRTIEGKIPNALSTLVWVLLALIGILVAAAVMGAFASSFHR